MLVLTAMQQVVGTQEIRDLFGDTNKKKIKAKKEEEVIFNTSLVQVEAGSLLPAHLSKICICNKNKFMKISPVFLEANSVPENGVFLF
jgi:hypothetical protein